MKVASGNLSGAMHEFAHIVQFHTGAGRRIRALEQEFYARRTEGKKIVTIDAGEAAYARAFPAEIYAAKVYRTAPYKSAPIDTEMNGVEVTTTGVEGLYGKRYLNRDPEHIAFTIGILAGV